MEATRISRTKDMIIELIKQALSEKIEETCSKIQEFEFDPIKSELNMEKHGIDFISRTKSNPVHPLQSGFGSNEYFPLLQPESARVKARQGS